LESEQLIPGPRAHGCEGQVDEVNEERALDIFREHGCQSVAIGANPTPREIFKAATVLAIAFRYTDGGPERG
jgi:hypothetical protein